MPDKDQRADAPRKASVDGSTQTTDAVRHVGRTLEADGQFLPTGELPENQIANEAGSRAVNVREAIADPLDREAEVMGAEPLQTRLPGDTSSDPHTDVGPDNATNLDTDRDRRRNNAA